jgi:hypothetical protein
MDDVRVSYFPLIANTHPKNLSIYQFYYSYGFEAIGHPIAFPTNRFGWEYRIRSSELGKRFIRTRYNLVISRDGSIGIGEVGTYVLRVENRTVRFALDASDHGHVVSQEAYDWCDLYFKASKWEQREYPAKVRPLVFGHNYLTRAHFDKLKALRTAHKTVDLVFINRILGGMEHNLRLFETLGALGCSKKLICITGGHEKPEHLERLRSAGVIVRPWLHQDAFWDEMSKGRLSFIRSGRKLCIPWKMSALLAMGATTVFDDRPRPNWPVPLEPGQHYIDCRLELSDARDSDDSVPGVDYSRITTAVETTLADDRLVKDIAERSAAYFDTHAAPGRVAEYIVRECIALV